MPTISERLAALKALCDEATGVKWIAMNEHNARCIAASRTATPALIAALEAVVNLRPLGLSADSVGYNRALEVVQRIIARHLEATDEQS